MVSETSFEEHSNETKLGPTESSVSGVNAALAGFIHGKWRYVPAPKRHAMPRQIMYWDIYE
jgi:hypothetical protein